MDSEPPENRTPAALQLANFLDRLSRWDVLNLAGWTGSDGPYWQGEIVAARTALATFAEDLETARRERNDWARRAGELDREAQAEEARAVKAEGDTARLRVALERIDALREVGPTWVTTYGDLATACEIARAALVVADEAPSEPPVVAGFQSEAGLGPIRKDGLAGGSLGAVEAPGRVTDGGPPQTTPGDSRSASVVSTAAKLRQRIHACANFCDLRLSAGEAAELDRLIIDAEESYGRLLAEAQSFEVAVVALPQGEPGDREADEALVREALAIGLEFDGRDGVSADESWDYFAKADAALVRLVAGVQAGRPPGTPNEAGAGDAAGAASSDTPRQGEPQ